MSDSQTFSLGGGVVAAAATYRPLGDPCIFAGANVGGRFARNEAVSVKLAAQLTAGGAASPAMIALALLRVDGSFEVIPGTGLATQNTKGLLVTTERWQTVAVGGRQRLRGIRLVGRASGGVVGSVSGATLIVQTAG